MSKEKKVVIDPKTIEKCNKYRKTLFLSDANNITTDRDCYYKTCFHECPVPEERDKIHPKMSEITPEIIAKCKEYRKTLNLPEEITIDTNRTWGCHFRVCYEKCPIAEERDKIYPPKTCPKCGKKFTYESKTGICDTCTYFKASGTVPSGLVGVSQGMTEKSPEKTHKKKDTINPKHIEDFLFMQQRVLSKLAWNPELYKILDKLSTQEILDRLVGKTGLEAVPVHIGGQAKLKANKSTEQHFAELEKKFAEEGMEPYESTAVEAEPLEDKSDGWRILFDEGKKREKKAGKKPKEKQEND